MQAAQQVIQELNRSLIPIRQSLNVQKMLDDAVRIQQVPAPTFHEKKRAAYIQKCFAHYDLQDVGMDDVYNVYGRLAGTDSSRPALLVSAHTDTVFLEETDLTIRREEGRIYGPGLGDNSLGVAGLLALMDIFQANKIRPAADIWFVANSREEGLGDLGGIKAVWERLQHRIGAAVVIEGMAFGRVYHAGIAVRRLHITCQCSGGHSWLHFGQPSAIHGLIDLGSCIISLTPPSYPRTTYNIGLIEGGHSVNSLATSAGLYLDLRSEEPATLAVLEQQVLSAMRNLQRPGMDFRSEVVGDRPSGHLDIQHPLVQLAAEALSTVNIQAVFETGSTDANALLAHGLPTVTVGLSYGGQAHRLDEFIETDPVADGIWQLVLLILAAANQRW